jgi:hypothetical protein
VILVDANLLIYAHDVEAPAHERARAWLDQRLNGGTRVGLPWVSILAFLRLITNPRVFPRPSTIETAWGVVRAWLGNESAWIPQPTERHEEILEQMLLSGGVAANLVPDAHLAALAVEHGLVLCSADRDFTRFPGLRFENPIEG